MDPDTNDMNDFKKRALAMLKMKTERQETPSDQDDQKEAKKRCIETTVETELAEVSSVPLVENQSNLKPYEETESDHIPFINLIDEQTYDKAGKTEPADDGLIAKPINIESNSPQLMSEPLESLPEKTHDIITTNDEIEQNTKSISSIQDNIRAAMMNIFNSSRPLADIVDNQNSNQNIESNDKPANIVGQTENAITVSDPKTIQEQEQETSNEATSQKEVINQETPSTNPEGNAPVIRINVDITTNPTSSVTTQQIEHIPEATRDKEAESIDQGYNLRPSVATEGLKTPAPPETATVTTSSTNLPLPITGDLPSDAKQILSTREEQSQPTSKKISFNTAKKEIEDFSKDLDRIEQEIKQKYGINMPDFHYEDSLPDDLKIKLIEDFFGNKEIIELSQKVIK